MISDDVRLRKVVEKVAKVFLAQHEYLSPVLDEEML